MRLLFSCALCPPDLNTMLFAQFSHLNAVSFPLLLCDGCFFSSCCCHVLLCSTLSFSLSCTCSSVFLPSLYFRSFSLLCFSYLYLLSSCCGCSLLLSTGFTIRRGGSRRNLSKSHLSPVLQVFYICCCSGIITLTHSLFYNRDIIKYII